MNVSVACWEMMVYIRVIRLDAIYIIVYIVHTLEQNFINEMSYLDILFETGNE